VRDKIGSYIRAKYPLIYIVSPEERRVVAELQQLATALEMRVRLWSIASGLDNDVAPPQIADPSAPLAAAAGSRERTLLVLRDYHPFLDGANAANVPIIRSLRETCATIKRRPRDQACSIVIVSPRLQLPEELRAEAVVLEWPLPSLDELRQLVGEVAEARQLSLNAGGEELQALASAASGLTYDEAQNCLARSLVATGKLDAELVADGKRQVVQREGVLEWIEPDGDLSLVGGLELLIAWLVERAGAYSQRARDFGLPLPRGVLLVGFPGCGKSLAARCLGLAWRCPVLRLDVGRLMSKWQGESESNLRKVFATVGAIGRCVVWVDEVEKALVSGSGETDGGVSSRMIGALLTWLQEQKSGAFVCATANDVTKLPPELMRKGRLDEIFFVDLPTVAERKAIVEVHLRKRQRDPALFDVAQLVKESAGLSGAEIEAAVVAGMFAAFSAGKVDVTTAEIATALIQTVPLSKTAPEKIEKVREWCRAGRARPASKPEAAAPGERFSEIEN
jgi:hypothetical protein